jgi:1-deoxy-D-xylulose-5-phosphate reductoisomerase
MAERRNICILGSTGSIGQNSLEVIANFPEMFRIVSLSANKNAELLRHQALRHKPATIVLSDRESALNIRSTLNGSVEVLWGESALEDIAGRDDVDVIINSLVGSAGLRPTITAVKHGKTVALANKESLVIAGELITRLAIRHKATIIPIDSEHSAILQCLVGEDPDTVARLILTASGGPFLNADKKIFPDITPEDALSHPTWKMGRKISIDSATLMNKGLEVIEAHWLFHLPPEKIEVLIHPQSIIHSMVEFKDGSVKAQLSIPDMKLPIQYALTYPDRHPSQLRRIDFAKLGQMTFLQPDRGKFECLDLAYGALKQGGTAPAILNAANEIAVALFLDRKISFDKIPRIIEYAIEKIPSVSTPTLDGIMETNTTVRRVITDKYGLTI